MPHKMPLKKTLARKMKDEGLKSRFKALQRFCPVSDLSTVTSTLKMRTRRETNRKASKA